MQKRILRMVLSAALVAMVVSSLAGCGGSEEIKTPVGNVNATEAQQETTVQPTTQSNAVVATVEETVMVDNDEIKITALSLGSYQYYHILNLSIENKTSSDLHVIASRTAVNGFVVEPTMGVNVSAGSTTQGEFRVRKSYVQSDIIADIETRFSYSSSDYSVNTKTERVKLETSAAATFDYSFDESGTVLHDADGIKIVCKGWSDNGYPIIYVYSTGELSEGCCVEEDELYVNGKKTYSNYCAWVFPNTRNLAEFDINDTDLYGNEIGKVESIKVSFKVSKENLADSNPLRTELVEIPVK